ncbi:phage tail protein, partial [Pseudomonas chlororaphis]|nr:phage tail protein [Pseudomonas chlororaphis]
DGWGIAGASVRIFTSNEVGDTTITSVAASFEHSELRSLWQSFQTEHNYNVANASSDELLLSMGIKLISPTDYSTGIAVNFSNAVNVNLSWELIR